MSQSAAQLSTSGRRHRVVVIGSGFGGLFATQALKRADVEVTMIARTTHHLFQPLLYQVATGILSEGEIAPSTREILAGQRNSRVLLGEVTDIDLAARTVTSTVLDQGRVTEYDSLIVAAGAGPSYFGNDHFAQFAPGMKSIDDALELRGRIFGSFEMAELAQDDEQRARLMTFVVVGAGPTGVEMAGQIVELAHRTLRHEFRSIDPRQARVILLDAAPSVLGTFGDRLGAKAHARLDEIGVEVQLGAKVVGLDGTGIEVEDAPAFDEQDPNTIGVTLFILSNLDGNRLTYDTMINTDGISLFRDPTFVRAIRSYYANVDAVLSFEESLMDSRWKLVDAQQQAGLSPVDVMSATEITKVFTGNKQLLAAAKNYWIYTNRHMKEMKELRRHADTLLKRLASEKRP